MSTPQPEFYVPPDPCVIFATAIAFQKAINVPLSPGWIINVAFALPNGEVVACFEASPTP